MRARRGARRPSRAPWWPPTAPARAPGRPEAARVRPAPVRLPRVHERAPSAPQLGDAYLDSTFKHEHSQNSGLGKQNKSALNSI